MDFGKALVALKQGKKVARKGWNGANMFAYLVPGGSYKSETDVAKKEFGDYTEYNPYLALKTVTGKVSTWAPSGSDALAEDWEILD